jgi:acid phosphatase
MEENHSYSDVIGNPAMPFLNSLAQKNALATNYFADVHTSIGNYFMLTTGQVITLDDAFTATVTQDNIVRELNGANKSWRSYAEGLPSAGYLGGDVYPYLRHHNPVTYFSDVTQSARPANNVLPFTQFAADLAANNLPNFSLVIPDAEHDAHDCPTGGQMCADNDRLAAADQWLQQNLTPLINNAAFQSSGLLLIVFDEGNFLDLSHGGGHVPVVIVSSRARTGFQSTAFYQHENTLRMIMQATGANRYPGASANAADMGEFFH